MKKLLFFSFAVFLMSCNGVSKKECIDKTKIKEDALCKDVYAPVCGCDGKQYSNVCRAESAGVTAWADGECPKK
jgi:hypothetical protein